MSTIEKYDSNLQTKSQRQDVKSQDNCLICKLMKIRHERADIVNWIFNSNKSTQEKIKLATLLTGIKFDREILDCMRDPNIKSFIFQE